MGSYRDEHISCTYTSNYWWNGRTGERSYVVCIDSIGKVPADGEVRIPDYIFGQEVKRLRLYDGPYRGIRKIHIGKLLDDVDFRMPHSGVLFPDLEEVSVDPDNENFSTDGRLLLSKNGDKLILCMADGTGTLRIPGSVTYLDGMALANTHFDEIVFRNRHLKLGHKALGGSLWLKRQSENVVFGNLLYHAVPDGDTLTIPDNVKDYHEDAFSDIVRGSLKSFVCRVPPSGQSAAQLSGYLNNAQVCIRSDKCRLIPSQLKALEPFAGISVSPDNERYCTKDGVLFSKDGKTLLYYPQGKKDPSYRIPDGTERISACAFRKNYWLQEAYMPDSVVDVGKSAFQECVKLSSVRLSERLTELPDASLYVGGSVFSGVFSGCQKLKSVTMPKSMKYIGKACFTGSGLETANLNEGLEMLGIYALASCPINSITLPSTLKRACDGSLLGIQDITAYEGTAKGLMSAVNAVPPGEKEAKGNFSWHPCTVHAIGKDGIERTFLIPEKFRRSEAWRIEQAWEGPDGGIDWAMYGSLLECMQDPGEKMKLALGCLPYIETPDDGLDVDDGPDGNASQDGGGFREASMYLGRNFPKAGEHLLDHKDSHGFLMLLEKIPATDAALEKLRKLAVKKGMAAAAAHVMGLQQGKKAKKKKKPEMSFRL